MDKKEGSKSLVTVETDTFTIYSPKDYPGRLGKSIFLRLAISDLSLGFIKQGIPIQCARSKKHSLMQDTDRFKDDESSTKASI